MEQSNSSDTTEGKENKHQIEQWWLCLHTQAVKKGGLLRCMVIAYAFRNIGKYHDAINIVYNSR